MQKIHLDYNMKQPSSFLCNLILKFMVFKQEESKMTVFSKPSIFFRIKICKILKSNSSNTHVKSFMYIAYEVRCVTDLNSLLDEVIGKAICQ